MFEEFDGKCVYCMSDTPFNEGTLDHIITKKEKGTRALPNLVYSCFDCNQRRGHTNFLLFIKMECPDIPESLLNTLIERYSTAKEYYEKTGKRILDKNENSFSEDGTNRSEDSTGLA